MSCREVVEFLMEYLSGELHHEQRAAFEEHLGECPECVAYLETYEETVKLAKTLHDHPDDQPAHDVPEDLVQAILAARRQRT